MYKYLHNDPINMCNYNKFTPKTTAKETTWSYVPQRSFHLNHVKSSKQAPGN